MFRTPFVWEVQVRREVLDEELQRLREIPHVLWRDVLGRAMTKRVTARDDRSYRITTLARWASHGSQNIRVTASLRSNGLGWRLMQQSFVITPENRFAE